VNETVRTIELYGVLLREGLIEGEDGGVSLDRPADAIPTLQKAFDLTDGMARRDPNDSMNRGRSATAARELGNVLRHRDPARALAIYDDAITRLAATRNLKARRDEALTLAESSYALRGLHRLADAGQRVARAVALLNDTRDLPAERVAIDGAVFPILRAQIEQLDAEGRSREALAAGEHLLDGVMRSSPDWEADLRNANGLSGLYYLLSAVAGRDGDTARAGEFANRRLELWRRWERQRPGNDFVRRRLAAASMPAGS